MAHQELFWQKFYENAWAFRADFMRSLLNKGKLNTYQIIHKLSNMERLYELSMTTADESVQWNAREFKDDNKLDFANIPIATNTSAYGNLLTVPYHFSYNFSDLLIDIYDKTGPYDSIVELGCGYGRNLFEIFYRGGPVDVPYFGGEFTNSGVQIATELATATPHMKTKFFHFNHLEPDLSDLDFGKKALVFTCHSIEQVREISDDWFKVVASAADEVVGVHLEPFGFQVKHLSEISQKHQKFMEKNHWNLNFAQVLVKASNSGIIILDDNLLENSLPEDPINPGSIAIWHSGNK
ncbi:hypothetical protein [Campylobacter pinnipediorum]|uniref:hypothetical protein n=1 Tax=Campylobacter pinnipediorum TaxID=1965231 RepID=UPI00084DADAD|nr:hypothetical protein [Campylobacter pinnipediorum]